MILFFAAMEMDRILFIYQAIVVLVCVLKQRHQLRRIAYIDYHVIHHHQMNTNILILNRYRYLLPYALSV